MLTAVTRETRPEPTGAVAVDESPSYDASFGALFALAYRIAYRVLGSRDAADDVACEAMTRAWLAWGRVSGYAPAWVGRVSGNLALSVVRRRARAARLPWGPSSPPASAASDLRRDLVAALRRLPRRQREVLVLRYLADLPEAEVAAALGCSVGTVKQHAHRALRALRSGASLDQEVS